MSTLDLYGFPSEAFDRWLTGGEDRPSRDVGRDVDDGDDGAREPAVGTRLVDVDCPF